MSTSRTISQMQNLGPVSEQWLKKVGIHTDQDLKSVGIFSAYKRVEEAGYKPSLNFLYAMFGAVEDMRWDEIPPNLKEQLRLQLENMS